MQDSSSSFFMTKKIILGFVDEFYGWVGLSWWVIQINLKLSLISKRSHKGWVCGARKVVNFHILQHLKVSKILKDSSLKFFSLNLIDLNHELLANLSTKQPLHNWINYHVSVKRQKALSLRRNHIKWFRAKSFRSLIKSIWME